MILRSRRFQREEPDRDARLIIIYCEGKKREAKYFRFFAGMSSRIRLEVEAPEHHNNTSPMGLYQKAEEQISLLNKSNPKYEIVDGDEIWFVIDTDQWGVQIEQLRGNCEGLKGVSVAQSNPCFEVWLLYHLQRFEPFEGIEIPKKWKQFVNEKVPGGFSSKKHALLINQAIKYAKEKFEAENGVMMPGITEVFRLAERFYPLIKDRLLKLANL